MRDTPSGPRSDCGMSRGRVGAMMWTVEHDGGESPLDVVVSSDGSESSPMHGGRVSGTSTRWCDIVARGEYRLKENLRTASLRYTSIRHGHAITDSTTVPYLGKRAVSRSGATCLDGFTRRFHADRRSREYSEFGHYNVLI